MSIRLTGVCAEVKEKKLLKKVKKLRKEFPNFDIRLHKNQICVEGDVKKYEIQKKIEKILLEEE